MHNLIVAQNYRDLVANCFSDKSQYKDNSVKGCRGLLALDRIIHRKSVILFNFEQRPRRSHRRLSKNSVVDRHRFDLHS